MAPIPNPNAGGEPNPQQPPSPATIPGGGDDKPRPSTHEVEAKTSWFQDVEFSEKL